MERFKLGQVVVTPRADEMLQAWGCAVEEILERHQAGDWGDVSESQRQLNEEGINKDLDVVSTYSNNNGSKLTVFTKSDRSYTLVHISPTTR